jgi:hypothetical protein
MTEIKYIVGDLFEAIEGNKKLIVLPHIVNSIGAWGAGFVLPLAKHFPVAEKEYRIWAKGNSEYGSFELGKVQEVFIPSRNVCIANMVGQEGCGCDSTGRPPIRYSALARCLRQVGVTARDCDAEIHAPAFGAGLAGGSWDFIEELIKECWCDWDIPVTIYSLEMIQRHCGPAYC